MNQNYHKIKNISTFTTNTKKHLTYRIKIAKDKTQNERRLNCIEAGSRPKAGRGRKGDWCLTDLHLSLDALLAAVAIVNLCLVVVVHYFDEFPRNCRVLQTASSAYVTTTYNS